jgi:hypothetical protein
MNAFGGQLRSHEGTVTGITFLGPRTYVPRDTNRVCPPQASSLSARKGGTGRLAGPPLDFMEGHNATEG